MSGKGGKRRRTIGRTAGMSPAMARKTRARLG